MEANHSKFQDMNKPVLQSLVIAAPDNDIHLSNHLTALRGHFKASIH